MSEPDAPTAENDPVLAAAAQLASVARANVTAWMEVLERLETFRDRRAAGMTYATILENFEGPTVVAIIAANQERLNVAASRFRRVVARMMNDEGLSRAAIARYFEVSRQRVSALLDEDEPDVIRQDLADEVPEQA